MTTPMYTSANQYDQWEEHYISEEDVLYFKIKQPWLTGNDPTLSSESEQKYQKAKSISEELYQQLREKGFQIKKIHLGFDTPDSFKVLIVADHFDFISEKFLSAFQISREKKEQSDNAKFSIDFIFTPDSATLDENLIANDGFFAKYPKG